MQFLVTAMDFTDAEALERRMEHRETHLKNVQQMISEGRFLMGGAILGEDESMIGSALILDFPDRQSLEDHLAKDPYIDGKVWDKVDIKTIKLVPTD